MRVRSDARALLGELERRRDGQPARQLDLPDLDQALYEVGTVGGVSTGRNT